MQRLLKVKMFYFHENGLKTYNKGNSGENIFLHTGHMIIQISFTYLSFVNMFKKLTNLGDIRKNKVMVTGV